VNLPFARTWWIDPGRIMGGRYPGTQDARESRRMLAALLDAGVRTLVNLQEPDEVGRGGAPFPDYHDTVEALARDRGVGVTFHRFPIADLDVPEAALMGRIMRCIRESVTNGGGIVYVHCWGGHGRTGTVAGCWMVECGVSPEAALEMITQRRAHDSYLARQPAPQTAEQIEFIRAWQRRNEE
jgi:hypothetical protein